eukprot:3453476-Prymnesium_polylepis.1
MEEFKTMMAYFDRGHNVQEELRDAWTRVQDLQAENETLKQRVRELSRKHGANDGSSSASPESISIHTGAGQIMSSEVGGTVAAASADDDVWTAAAWLTSLNAVTHVGAALFGGTKPSDELAAIRALASATTSEAALAERLRAGKIVETLAMTLLPAFQQLLAASSVTGSELHSKFVLEGRAFTMKYGDLSTFFGGLEAKIGAPHPAVGRAMADEHMAASDSKDEFTTGNYNVTTTPE